MIRVPTKLKRRIRREQGIDQSTTRNQSDDRERGKEFRSAGEMLRRSGMDNKDKNDRQCDDKSPSQSFSIWMSCICISSSLSRNNIQFFLFSVGMRSLLLLLSIFVFTQSVVIRQPTHKTASLRAKLIKWAVLWIRRQFLYHWFISHRFWC